MPVVQEARVPIPGWVLPKTPKMVSDASLLNTQNHKVWIKRKIKQSRDRSSAFPSTWCSNNWKGNLQVTLDYGWPTYNLCMSHMSNSLNWPVSGVYNMLCLFHRGKTFYKGISKVLYTTASDGSRSGVLGSVDNFFVTIIPLSPWVIITFRVPSIGQIDRFPNYLCSIGILNII